MEGKIQWETELDSGLQKAKAEKKAVVLDFFNPGWIGCQQMDAVTYPNSGVQAYFKENAIPVRVASDHEKLSKQFGIKWTPTLITLDPEGAEHHRTVGFLDPDELIPSLMLGRAKVDFDQDNFDGAIRTLESLLKNHPKSGSTPEAIFLLGVSRYKSTLDPKPLKEAYERLKAEYSDSEWTKRAYPYRLL
jgi:hypothetical protein